MNGAMGAVVDIHCETPKGPNDKSIDAPLPAQVIVDFSQFTLSEDKRISDELPITCVAITPMKD